MIRSELHSVRRPFFDCTGGTKGSRTANPVHTVAAPSPAFGAPMYLNADVERPMTRLAETVWRSGRN